MAYRNLYNENQARKSEAEKADDRARGANLTRRTELVQFLNKFFEEFDERIKRPYDGISFKGKASTIEEAKTKFGYNETQKGVIDAVVALKGKIGNLNPNISKNLNSFDYELINRLLQGIIEDGKAAFPVGGQFPRVARLWTSDGKNKRNLFAFTPKPKYFAESTASRKSREEYEEQERRMEEIRKQRREGTYKPPYGGKRSTKKRRTHKRSTKKRRTSRRN
jgi:hypothetical protein